MATRQRMVAGPGRSLAYVNETQTNKQRLAAPANAFVNEMAPAAAAVSASTALMMGV